MHILDMGWSFLPTGPWSLDYVRAYRESMTQDHTHLLRPKARSVAKEVWQWVHDREIIHSTRYPTIQKLLT